MAVVAKWMCDRDNTMFDSKKEADAHDKMLELAEQFTALLQREISDVNEAQAEDFGILLARHKELLMQACKGKVDALDDIRSATTDTVRKLA